MRSLNHICGVPPCMIDHFPRLVKRLQISLDGRNVYNGRRYRRFSHPGEYLHYVSDVRTSLSDILRRISNLIQNS